MTEGDGYKNSSVAIAIVAVFIMPLHIIFAPIASMQSRRQAKKFAKLYKNLKN